ncbi:unnamed protein product [Brassica rapa subsp. trilocularis]|uniref:O-acyltransferase WSD1 C-terminal domain-containing protein n=1 Tax=Brassica campestris TaxID=3711 RepID=M4ECG4_BRACM
MPIWFTNSLSLQSPDPADPGTWPLLHVKVIFFRDRGFAVAVSASHKVCDAASLSMFVRSWTKAAKGFVRLLISLWGFLRYSNTKQNPR